MKFLIGSWVLARWVGLLALVALLFSACGCECRATERTENFVVDCAANVPEEFESTIAAFAERQRKDLAIYWLGKELPRWDEPCPIRIQRAAGSTGETFFQHRPLKMRMTCRGENAEAICQDVLPHEVTHCVLHSHFRRPLPRWYDEGIASFVETPDARKRLDPHRGGQWDFRIILNSKAYPQDPRKNLQVYAVGASAIEVLAGKGSPQDLIECGEVAQERSWEQAIDQVYQISVDELEAEVRALRPQYQLHRGVYYTMDDCEGCLVFEAAKQSPRFQQLGIHWRRIDVQRTPRDQLPRNLQAIPDFVVNGYRYRDSHKRFSEDALYAWLTRILKPPPGAAPTTSPPTASAPAPALSEPIIDLPWEGLRFVGMVGAEQGLERKILGGVIRRMIEYLSGGHATLELVYQDQTKAKYTAIMEAGHWSDDVDVFGFIMVADTAHVGFIKGRILKRIESGIQDRLNPEQMEIPIEPVFKRTSPADYDAIMTALSTVEPAAAEPAERPAVQAPVTSPVIEKIQSRLNGTLRLVKWAIFIAGANLVFGIGGSLLKHIMKKDEPAVAESQQSVVERQQEALARHDVSSVVGRSSPPDELSGGSFPGD